MTSDDGTVHALRDLVHQGFSGCGSPARLAALLLLGQHPVGVRSDDLRKAIRTADARVWDESRMQNVLTAIRTAGLAAVERDERGCLWWYSPGARQVAKLRGTWPPAGLGGRQPVQRAQQHVGASPTTTTTQRTTTTGATA